MRDVARVARFARPERHALRKRRERRGEEAACRRGGHDARARRGEPAGLGLRRRARGGERGPRGGGDARREHLGLVGVCGTAAARAHPRLEPRGLGPRRPHVLGGPKHVHRGRRSQRGWAGHNLRQRPRFRRRGGVAEARRRRQGRPRELRDSVHARAGDPRAHLARAHGAAQPQRVVAATRAREGAAGSASAPAPAERYGVAARPCSSASSWHVSSVAATGTYATSAAPRRAASIASRSRLSQTRDLSSRSSR